MAEVELTLEDHAGGSQSWDGVADPAVERIEFSEALPALGENVWIPVRSVVPDGLPIQVPLLDASSGVVTHHVHAEYVAGDSGCALVTTDEDLPPLSVMDTETLPPAPPRVAVFPRDGAWTARPTIGWTLPDEYEEATMTAADFDYPTGTWSLRLRPGCGESAQWPTFLGEFNGGTDGTFELRAVGATAEATCTERFELGGN